MEQLTGEIKQAAEALAATASGRIDEARKLLEAVAPKAREGLDVLWPAAEKAITEGSENVLTEPVGEGGEGGKTQVTVPHESGSAIFLILPDGKVQLQTTSGGEAGGAPFVLMFDKASASADTWVCQCDGSQMKKTADGSTLVMLAGAAGEQVNIAGQQQGKGGDNVPTAFWSDGKQQVSLLPDGACQINAKIGPYDVIQIASDKTMIGRVAEGATPADAAGGAAEGAAVAAAAGGDLSPEGEGVPTVEEAKALVAAMEAAKADALEKIATTATAAEAAKALIATATADVEEARAKAETLLGNSKTSDAAAAAAAGADSIPVAALEDGTTGKLKTNEAGELVVEVVQFVDKTRGSLLFKDKATTVWFAPSALPEEGAEAASPQQVIFQEGSTQAALKDGAVVITQGDAVVVNMGSYVVQRGAGASGQPVVQIGETQVVVDAETGSVDRVHRSGKMETLKFPEGILMCKMAGGAGEWMFNDGNVVVIARAGAATSGASSPRRALDEAVARDGAINS